MTTQTEPKAIKPIDEWLAEQRNGATAVELAEHLNALVAGVAEHGKKGELTLKITVKRSGDGMVTVDDEIKVKPAEPDRASSIYFVDDDGNLVRNNPAQERLELREVNKVREISQ